MVPRTRRSLASQHRGARSASFAAVRAVFQKDWRSEWRTRAALNAIVLVFRGGADCLSFNVARQVWRRSSGRLSVERVAVRGLVGLPRVFVREEESGTAAQLRLACAP
jgi:ABC-type transport system involved in cytochrome c biogenesis permease component